MRIDSLIHEHERSKAKRYIGVVVHNSGKVSVTGSDMTFPNEKAMDEHFMDKPVNLIVRRIIEPEHTR
ncbi:MAG TPA: hypothetical protein DD671_17255 [Balneolaceae bacterium]|nr:hypothetical protein [Balneolaceae bacterium]